MISNVTEGAAVSLVGDSAVTTPVGGASAGIATAADLGGVGFVACAAAGAGAVLGMTITFPDVAGFGVSAGDGTGVSSGVGVLDTSSVAAAIGVEPVLLAVRKVTVESKETC